MAKKQTQKENTDWLDDGVNSVYDDPITTPEPIPTPIPEPIPTPIPVSAKGKDESNTNTSSSGDHLREKVSRLSQKGYDINQIASMLMVPKSQIESL